MELKLNAEHEHAGKVYAKESIIDVCESTAEWLIGNGVATQTTPTETSFENGDQ